MFKFYLIVIFSFTLHFLPITYANEPIEGCFVAKKNCEAFRSIRKKTNPSKVRLEKFNLYEVQSKNKDKASYYQVNIPNINAPKRWVSSTCGNYVPHCRLLRTNTARSSTMNSSDNNADTNPSLSEKQYLLALSWEPTFCETHQNKPECKNMTAKRHDASNLSLHGLWPQPQSNAYCGVDGTDKAIDRRKKWHLLEKLDLSDSTVETLKIVMPGYLSKLHRHEWVKHGTCYNKTAEQYYLDSIALTKKVNNSLLGKLLEDYIGKTVTKKQIHKAFEDSFGAGSASKISMKCDRKGRFSELWINLGGDISPDAKLSTLLKAANKASKGNCSQGIVDAAE